MLPAQCSRSLSQAHSASGWNSHPTSVFLQPPGKTGQLPFRGAQRQIFPNRKPGKGHIRTGVMPQGGCYEQTLGTSHGWLLLAARNDAPSIPQPLLAIISSHSPSCFVMALASSARPALGPGAFGGFESQSAELYLRTNQKEKSLSATGQRAGKSRLQTAFSHHYPASMPSSFLQLAGPIEQNRACCWDKFLSAGHTLWEPLHMQL